MSFWDNKRILVTGGTGFLGTHLVGELVGAGHQVTRLVRREPGPDEARWDPYVDPRHDPTKSQAM